MAEIEKSGFVIQKHDDSHLHYDFLLEMEGELRPYGTSIFLFNPPNTATISINIVAQYVLHFSF